MAGGVVATARGAVAAVNQQPFTVNRRQSAPPLSATSPSQGVNADPSVSRKKLIYTQRPLSKYIYVVRIHLLIVYSLYPYLFLLNCNKIGMIS